MKCNGLDLLYILLSRKCLWKKCILKIAERGILCAQQIFLLPCGQIRLQKEKMQYGYDRNL